MREFNPAFDTISNLDNNPNLREILIEYCKIQYEENAIVDDEHLIREYLFLRDHNRLDELRECEMLINYFKNETT